MALVLFCNESLFLLFSAPQIRNELETQMNCNLKEFKEFIDNEMLLILGQMDKPSLIFDHLYLVRSAAQGRVWFGEHPSTDLDCLELAAESERGRELESLGPRSWLFWELLSSTPFLWPALVCPGARCVRWGSQLSWADLFEGSLAQSTGSNFQNLSILGLQLLTQRPHPVTSPRFAGSEPPGTKGRMLAKPQNYTWASPRREKQ